MLYAAIDIHKADVPGGGVDVETGETVERRKYVRKPARTECGAHGDVRMSSSLMTDSGAAGVDAAAGPRSTMMSRFGKLMCAERSENGAMDAAALLVVPFVDEGAPDNARGVLRDAYEMVDRLAASAFGLRGYVLEDRAAVSELARRIGLRPTMGTNGVFVTIVFVDADEPTRPLHDAGWFADVFQPRGIPAIVVADPSTIDLVVEGLDATHLDM